MSTTLAAAGLVMNMAGAAVAFFVGFPQPEFQGDVRLLESSPSAEDLATRRARRRRWSYVGPVVMFTGFALQTVALYL